MGVEPSFSDNLRPPAVRLGTATNDFTPESEEEVRQSFNTPIFRSRHFAMSETILCDVRPAQHRDQRLHLESEEECGVFAASFPQQARSHTSIKTAYLAAQHPHRRIRP